MIGQKSKSVYIVISLWSSNHLLVSPNSNLQSHFSRLNRQVGSLEDNDDSGLFCQVPNITTTHFLTHPHHLAQKQPQCQAVFGAQINDNPISESKTQPKQSDPQTPLTSPPLGHKGFVIRSCYPDPKTQNGEEYCIYVNQKFNKGNGISILLNPSRFLEIINKHTIFDQEEVDEVDSGIDPQSIDTPYEVIDMPEKHGVGLQSTRKLHFGDQILIAHPILVIHVDRLSWPDDYWGKVLRHMVDGLPPAGHQAISKLYGVGRHTEEWLRSVFDLNSFDMSLDKELPIQVVIPNASTFNHDCRPNVAYQFDSEKLQIKTYAMREIEKGEELTISYFGLWLDWKERQHGLRGGYGFKCTCAQCSLSITERFKSDQRVETISQHFETLNDWSEESLANEEIAESLIKALKEENIRIGLEMAYLLAAREYNGSGNMKMTKFYASLALTHGELGRGKDWEYVDEIELLIHHPEQHWSYRNRPSARAMPTF